MSDMNNTQNVGNGRRDLMRAKMALVAAREQGATEALGAELVKHPADADELTTFAMALIATASYDAEPIPADVCEVAARARTQAFAVVFGEPVAAPVAVAAPQGALAGMLSLKALRQARGLGMKTVAERLGLGADVLSALEAGRIAVASVPERLTNALGELLGASLDQLTGAMSLSVQPALRRSQVGAVKGDQAPAPLDFAEVVRQSPSMSAQQKAAWLAE
ncbi:MAG: helix-turn-helix transcriptional regulator [Ktedonobacterales bacterium]